MGMNSANQAKITRAIQNLEPFSHGNMSGFPTDGRNLHPNAASGEAWSMFQDEVRADMVAYVILSYSTMIGWVRHGGMVVVPRASYSVTTSQHQGIARRADR